MNIKAAKEISIELLKNNPIRINNVLGVVSLTIENLISNGCKENSDVFEKVVCSAYLHDIGYSEQINHTGFHPYDGYVHLKELGIDEDICSLVLHHTGAKLLIDMFPEQFEDSVVGFYKKTPELTKKQFGYLLYLDKADARTDSQGFYVTVEERLKDISDRYGESHYLTIHFKQFCELGKLRGL